MTKPVPVALGYLEREGKFLAVERESNDYPGLYGFPGGKVEVDEHIREALVREVIEETGLEVRVTGFLGLVSENISGAEAAEHTIINFFELELVENHGKGEHRTEWIDLEEIEDEDLIPSGRRMIQEIILGGKNGYYESKVNRKNGDYIQEKFEKVI